VAELNQQVVDILEQYSATMAKLARGIATSNPQLTQQAYAEAAPLATRLVEIRLALGTALASCG
jgi:hypothetical protein